MQLKCECTKGMILGDEISGDDLGDFALMRVPSLTSGVYVEVEFPLGVRHVRLMRVHRLMII